MSNTAVNVKFLSEFLPCSLQLFTFEDAETQEDGFEFPPISSNKELNVYNKILKEGIYQALVMSGCFADCDVCTYS